MSNKSDVTKGLLNILNKFCGTERSCSSALNRCVFIQKGKLIMSMFFDIMNLLVTGSVKRKEIISSTTNKGILFTPTEIKHIRVFWKKAKERQATLELLVEVIKKKPSLALLFGIKLETEPDLRTSPAIVGHSVKITQFIDTIVSSLDELTVDEIRRTVAKVGVLHFRRNVNFDAENWLMFKNILMEKICHNVNEQTRIAWFKLLHLMVMEMKSGFLVEALRNGSKPRSEKSV